MNLEEGWCYDGDTTFFMLSNTKNELVGLLE